MDTSDLQSIVYKKDRIELDNKFSVAMLTIPIKCSDTDDDQMSILKRLVEVRRETTALRSCVDFYVISLFFFIFVFLRPLYTKNNNFR